MLNNITASIGLGMSWARVSFAITLIQFDQYFVGAVVVMWALIQVSFKYLHLCMFTHWDSQEQTSINLESKYVHFHCKNSVKISSVKWPQSYHSHNASIPQPVFSYLRSRENNLSQCWSSKHQVWLVTSCSYKFCYIFQRRGSPKKLQ